MLPVLLTSSRLGAVITTVGGELTTMTCVLLPSTPSASLAVQVSVTGPDVGWCSEVGIERSGTVYRAACCFPLDGDRPAFRINGSRTDLDGIAGIDLLRRGDGHVGRRIVSDSDGRISRSGYIGDANRVGIGDAE